MTRKILLIIILIWGAMTASAQLYRYLEPSDGLSCRRVIAIEKDQKGYMWFLTQEGVDKYNGKQFTNYKLSNHDRDLQQFPNLSQLHIDLEGGIWVTGKSGCIFKYNTHQDQYDLVMNFADSLKSTRRLPLTHTTIDHQNNLWLCTRYAQYVYQTKTGHTVRLESPIKEEITYIEQGIGNVYFIGTTHNVFLAELKKDKLELTPTPSLENIHRVQHLYYHEGTDRLLIGTMADGFYVFDLQTKELHNIGNMKDVTMNKAIPASPSTEEVLIATDGNGVYKLNMKTLELHSYLSSFHTSEKLNGDIIKDIYLDNSDRVWMAVFPLSITIYSNQYPKYDWLRYNGNDLRINASNQVTSVIEDSDGDIWTATSNGIGCYHTRTKKWSTLLSSQEQGNQEENYVYISLCEVSPGVILAGGYMSGMYLINKKDMSYEYFSPQTRGYPNIRPDKYIRSIYRDEEGIVWAGGYYNFKSINLTSGEIEHFQTDYPISFITSRNPKELWVGTINGLYKFNKEQKKLQQVKLPQDVGAINTIYQTDSVHTYIGAHGTGLWVYNSERAEIQNYTTSNSALISDNIYCILPSNRPGELIISTDNELVCFNPLNKTFMNWSQEQGMLNEGFNTSAGAKTRKGHMLFGSNNGLIVIKDTINIPHNVQSKLIFNELNILYQRMLPGMEDSPLSVPFDDTHEITLPYDQNIISIGLSSINYERPSRIRYTWKLEGFYDQWTKLGTSSTIRYTGLAPGTYNLQVKSMLIDDGRLLGERSLLIHIKPPFSRTTWAYVIYVLIALLITFAILRYLWLQKNSELSREKIQFFINTAHDIRTPLTLIKGPLDEINRMEQLSEKGMENLQDAIRNTDSLSELATKLIEFQKEERYTSNIRVTACELNSYVQEFVIPFLAFAKKKHIQLDIATTGEPLDVWIDKNKVDSILHNLLSNALKYTPEGGKVNITISALPGEWQLSISDTGIGIPANEQKKMFKSLFRGENAINQRITGTGIGMLLTYRLVKRHLGKITVDSKENEGTTFCLRIPINHRRYIRIQAETLQKEVDDHIIQLNQETAVYKCQENTDQNAKEILIVEDNPSLRQFLHRSLCETYRIQEAANGQEALELINKRQPDLVISDIMMPVMRGDDLCQTLKSQVETSHIPIILLTALGNRENILHGLNVKADSYVVKPFDLDILKANIASVLANKEFIRQRFSQLNYRTEDLPKEVKEAPGLSLDQEFLTKATALIRKNLGKDFNVDDLCLEMGMSRSSLYNKVKALTDHSPSDFIRQVRLKEASALLKSKKYTVAEVSDMLGFSDPKYFTETFKKHYGMTPSAYMKNLES